MMELGGPRRRERCTTASMRTLRLAGGRGNEASARPRRDHVMGLAGACTAVPPFPPDRLAIRRSRNRYPLGPPAPREAAGWDDRLEDGSGLAPDRMNDA